MFEGRHGFYRAFAPSRTPDFAPLLDGLGTRWILETIAFKPYACGTMTQPFIDCAIELARADVKRRGHRQHGVRGRRGHRASPVGAARGEAAPPNGYAAKFSTPYCIAVGFLDGKAGFEQFTDERVMDPSVRALAAKVSYVIDPHNDYPQELQRAHPRDAQGRDACAKCASRICAAARTSR